MISFIIPTRNRSRELARTLERLAALPVTDTGRGAEVIIVDNASEPPVRAPATLRNGLPVDLIRLEQNLGAAARNIAAEAARAPWLVMLDDDSAPADAPAGASLAGVLPTMPHDIAAIGGEITLPHGAREAGGLPEVIVGCGAVVRRNAFLEVGGYDPSFEYYVEEYDLCAKLIAAGHRIVHTRRLHFEHRKVQAGRSFASILRRLVRNNGWTILRYAPAEVRDDAMAAMLRRYEAIADREGVSAAFAEGSQELARSSADQPGRTLSRAHWDRFTGAAAVQSDLIPSLASAGETTVRLIDPGKGADVISAVLQRNGIAVREEAEALVIGTLSPGPMLDALERWEDGVFMPWAPDGADVDR